MQEKRLELSWYCYHTDLNRARLPIPPFLRTSHILSVFLQNVNRIFAIFYILFQIQQIKPLEVAAEQISTGKIIRISTAGSIGSGLVCLSVCSIINERSLG